MIMESSDSGSISSSFSLCTFGFNEAFIEDGFCVDLLPIQNVGQPRSIRSVGTNDFIYLDRVSDAVVYVYDSDGDSIADSQSVVATISGLNHGLALHGGYLYASTETQVYRWPIQHQRSNIANGTNIMTTNIDEAQVVIENINEGGQGGAPFGHTTRTLAFSPKTGALYVSVGSAGNVDNDSTRSRIRRFPEFGDPTFSNFPIRFIDGEIFADGLRNEVGMTFDRFDVLWGVENSADNLRRNDLGGDIHNENPGDELNRFPEELAGQHWGYPYCWTEFLLPSNVGNGPNSRWAWPSFMPQYTDEWCRTQTVQSEFVIQAHSAPLGIVFYRFPKETHDNCFGTFPQEMDGYAFMAYHGSWNRDIPTGYKVVYLPINESGRVPANATAHDLLTSQGPSAKFPSGFRPVDVDFDDCGRLLVSSDGSRGNGAGLARISYVAGGSKKKNEDEDKNTHTMVMKDDGKTLNENGSAQKEEEVVGTELPPVLTANNQTSSGASYSFRSFYSSEIVFFFLILKNLFR